MYQPARIVVALAAMWTLCGGCTADSAGQLSLVFAWQEQPSQAVWLWLRAEERPEDAGARILASAGPVRYEPGGQVDIELPTLPSGADRVIVLEARAEANEALPVRYYGISEPFELQGGSSVTVPVPIALLPPESARHPATVQLLFDGVARPTVNATEAAAATVRIRASGTVAAVLANDTSFSANLRTVPLETGDGVTCQSPETDAAGVTWRDCRIAGWDLLAGIPSDLGDGSYSVFVSLIDPHGYESRTSAAVLLDTEPPQIISASLSQPATNGYAPFFVNATLSEPLSAAAEAGVLRVLGDDAQAVSSGPAEREGETLSYSWITTFNGVAPWQRYTFALDLTDAVGNRAPAPIPLLDEAGGPLILYIDDTPPQPASDRLEVEAVVPGSLAADGRVAFTVGLVEHFAHTGLAGPAIGPDGPIEDPGSAPPPPSFDTLPPTYPGAVDLTLVPCVDHCPLLILDGREVGQATEVSRTPDVDYTWLVRFDHAIAAADWPGVHKDLAVEVSWDDLAGNGATWPVDLGEPVTVDFVTQPPR